MPLQLWRINRGQLVTVNRKHQVDSSRQPATLQADSFIDAAANPVADDGRFTDLAADDDGDTVWFGGIAPVGFEADGAASDITSSAIHPLEAAVAVETVAAPQHDETALGRKLSAAFEPAPLEHGAATAIGHPL